MKITALLVEPTLIGLAVLAAIALAVSPALDSWLLDPDASNLVIVTAVAYFLGITFDRTADTILNRLLVLHRHKFWREKELKKLKKVRKKPARDQPGVDRFPEDRYHLEVMQGPAAWEYLSYLRSRIRLTRALLVLMPALGVAAAIRLASEAPWLRMSAIVVVVFVYALALVTRSGKLPRTDAPRKKIREAFKHLRLKPTWRLASREEPLIWFVIGLAAVAGMVMFAGSLLPPPAPAGYVRAAGRALLLTAGTLLAVAVLFSSWWRITGTYFDFLWNRHEFSRPVPTRPTGPHPPSH